MTHLNSIPWTSVSSEILFDKSLAMTALVSTPEVALSPRAMFILGTMPGSSSSRGAFLGSLAQRHGSCCVIPIVMTSIITGVSVPHCSATMAASSCYSYHLAGITTTKTTTTALTATPTAPTELLLLLLLLLLLALVRGGEPVLVCQNMFGVNVNMALGGLDQSSAVGGCPVLGEPLALNCMIVLNRTASWMRGCCARWSRDGKPWVLKRKCRTGQGHVPEPPFFMFFPRALDVDVGSSERRAVLGKIMHQVLAPFTTAGYLCPPEKRRRVRRW